MFIKEKITQLIKKAILEAQKQRIMPKFEMPEILVMSPPQEEFGDYTTNVAMQISNLVKLPSQKIAELIVHRILTLSEVKDILNKVVAVKPGFINFTLERVYLLKELAEILRKGERYGDLSAPKRKKIQIEFISANPTGKLHIGHGRGAFLGDVLSNVLKKAGYKVTKEYYINDSKQSKQIKALGELVMGRVNPYKTEFVKKLIEELKKELKQKKKKRLSEGDLGYLLAQKIQLYNRQFIEQKLKIHFDVWFSEEDLYRLGAIEKTLRWLDTFGFLYKKDGALWFRTSKFGDDKDRVLIRKNGEATYFLSDIVYHRNKFERFDKVINIWGADHHGYVKRMEAAAEAFGRKKDLKILITQMVRLVKHGKEVKMSKREGTVIDLEWLINEVGLDAARFFYLLKSPNSHMDFDLDLAREQSKNNPVFYVQYAYARICSIIEKLKTVSKDFIFDFNNQNNRRRLVEEKLNLLSLPEELNLIRKLIKFPEIIEEISKHYTVHYLPVYTISLAEKFHNFYERCRVISEDQELQQARFFLVFATKIVLESAFKILGIRTKKRM